MRLVRTATALLRLIVAASFVIMSLGHGPVMAFAMAKAPGAAHEMAAGPSWRWRRSRPASRIRRLACSSSFAPRRDAR